MAAAQRQEVAPVKLPGFTFETGAGGQCVLRKANALDAHTAENQLHSGNAPSPTSACCSCLNSTAQPRPLPAPNHSPGTAMFNSTHATKLPSQLLLGQGDEPHSLFQGAESAFTTATEAID